MDLGRVVHKGDFEGEQVCGLCLSLSSHLCNFTGNNNLEKKKREKEMTPHIPAMFIDS